MCSVLTSHFYGDTGCIGLGPTLINSFNFIPLWRLSLLWSSHSEVLAVRIPAYGFWGNTIPPLSSSLRTQAPEGPPWEPHRDRPTNHTCLVKGSLELTRPQLASPCPLGTHSSVLNRFSTPRKFKSFPELFWNFRVGENGAGLASGTCIISALHL